MCRKSRAALFGKGPEFSRVVKKRESADKTHSQVREENYELSSTANWRALRIPGVDFSKQLQRTSSKTQSATQIVPHFNQTMRTHSSIKKRVRGVIPLDKQMARQGSLCSQYVQDYQLNYGLVFPKVQTRVHYEKEIRSIRSKAKSRKPLLFPMSVGPPKKKLFLL